MNDTPLNTEDSYAASQQARNRAVTDHTFGDFLPADRVLTTEQSEIRQPFVLGVSALATKVVKKGAQKAVSTASRVDRLVQVVCAQEPKSWRKLRFVWFSLHSCLFTGVRYVTLDMRSMNLKDT